MLKTPIGIKFVFVYLLQLSVLLGASHGANDDEWSFIVLADWHNAESFAIDPGKNSKTWDDKYDQIHNIKQTYGGDLVVLPGDSNNGKWDTIEFATKFKPNLAVKERVLHAGKNCYGTMRRLFRKAGYETILIAVGDHEIGGNAWAEGSTKIDAIQEYRAGFAEGFNTDPSNGKEMFTKPIGSASSKPIGTPFQFTSYAHQHKNVLFITVDAFNKMATNFMDKDNGTGGEGAVTCTVVDGHLRWFTNVLSEARKDNTIKHIIVQAHLPIIQPVRKVSCSGQFMDYGEESQFWKTMVKYEVDIYLAGEVHTNTATRDPDSNLLQIVSRGNSINNFLKVVVTDYTLSVTAYNEIGQKKRYNNNYVAYGNLTVNKSIKKFTDKESIGKDIMITEVKSNTVACGSSTYCDIKPPMTISHDAKYPVRCCSDYDISSLTTKKHGKKCPFAASCFYKSTFDKFNLLSNVTDDKSCGTGGFCGKALSYGQAEILCAAVGGYICTAKELANGCAKSTGCSYSRKLVWANKRQQTRSSSDITRSENKNEKISTVSSLKSPTYHIFSSGVLELLDRTSALVHLNFDQIVPLESRQVVGMHHDDEEEILVGKRITIREIECSKSLPNQGSLGQPYDAQVAGVDLVRDETGTYGKFTNQSRLAIYGTGPHGGGGKISYAIRIKTSRNAKMILVHYGHMYGNGSSSILTKNIFTLTLEQGIPRLYVNANSVLKPNHLSELNDGRWHDIAVSMPSKSCTLSEVVMYIDGDIIETKVRGNDERIFFVTSGRMSIGGFGYSHTSFENLFPRLKAYIGEIDHFSMWGRSIGEDDLKLRVPDQSRYYIQSHSKSPSEYPSNIQSHSKSPSEYPSTSPSISRTRDPRDNQSPSISRTRDPKDNQLPSGASAHEISIIVFSFMAGAVIIFI